MDSCIDTFLARLQSGNFSECSTTQQIMNMTLCNTDLEATSKCSQGLHWHDCEILRNF